jgi:hypothetical protein
MIKQLSLLFVAVLAMSVVNVNGANCMTEVMQDIYTMGNQLSALARGYFVFGGRENAIAVAAIHDAVNTIQQDYNFWRGEVRPQGVSRSEARKAHECAAVVSAYRHAFLNITVERKASNSATAPYVPEPHITNFKNQINAFYDSKIASYRNENSGNNHQKRVDNGIAMGVFAAQRVLDERYDDGFNAVVTEPAYPPSIGQWSKLTANPFDYPQWRLVRTWVLNDARTFLAPPPPSVDDPQYIKDLEITKYVGGSGSVAAGNATSANFQSARWWNGASNAHVGMTMFVLQERENWNLRKTIAAYLIVSLAGADQNIAVFNQKDYFNFWRPQHAIKNQANLDYTGHAGLQRLQESGWSPALPTPNNQEYPAGHPTNTGSQAIAMKIFLGYDQFPGGPVVVNYDNAPNPPVQPQTFASFSDLQNQVRWARIYAGIHLFHSCLAGEALAAPIAAVIAARIRPAQELDDLCEN